MPAGLQNRGSGRPGLKGWPLVQIQDNFSGASLATLAEAGLGIYQLIPDYRLRCPLCRGAGCAVRHGLYFRKVADRDGKIYKLFPVPRFRCQRKGPADRNAVTFSVLPAELVSRHRWSLALMLRVLKPLLAGLSIGAVLDTFSEVFRQGQEPCCPEVTSLYRVLRLFSTAYCRLQVAPLEGLLIEHGLRGLRPRAAALVRLMTEPQRKRGSPVVLAFHRRYFPELLLVTRS